MEDIWKEVFTTYQKDPRILREWVEELKKLEPEEALDRARSCVLESEIVPNAVTLGFSPQVLVAALALNRGRITVITSPEVSEGRISAAQFSHDVLSFFSDYVHVITADFAPKNGDVQKLMDNLVETFNTLHPETILDISGGTQLVAIAALMAGLKKLTYSYPTPGGFKFYPINPSPFKVYKMSLNYFDLDLSYLYPDAVFEFDGVVETSGTKSLALFEDLSEESCEWDKVYRRALVSPHLPPTFWSRDIKTVRTWALPENFNVELLKNKLIESVKFESEKLNFIIYANTILSSRKILNDKLKFQDTDLLNFINSSYENWNGQDLTKLKGKQKWYLYPQFGFGEYSLNFLVKSIEKLVNYMKSKGYVNPSKLEITIVANKRIMDLCKKLYERLKNKYNVKIMMVKKDKSQLEIENNSLNIIFGDYSKGILKRVLDAPSNRNYVVMVIPETTIIPKDWKEGRENPEDREVVAVSGFLNFIKMEKMDKNENNIFENFLKFRVVVEDA